ncbi:MAG TPA: hypothetical protein VNT52_18650, partial [Acidimicrobiales bacterium]|nr:hypothetical protein [Acidimicrobiales bacterium]
PALERIAIDLSNAPNAIGLRVGPSTGWFEGSRVMIKGGYRSIDHHGPNASYERFMCDSPSDCHFFMDEFGAEVDISRMNFARNIAGTTDAYMKVIYGAPPGGDLELSGIKCQSAPGLGMFVTNGIIISCAVAAEVNVVAKAVRIDNVVGGGPGLTLHNAAGVDWEGGWINSAPFDGSHPGGPCVRITGGYDLTFRGNKYRGGGAQLKTYDFVGGATWGFRSRDNYCPTGPVYWLPASGKPTDMGLDDYVPGATDVGQITNDVEGLRTAIARRWGALKLIDRLSLTHVPWMSSPAIGIGQLVAGQVTMAAPDVDSFYTQIIPFRLTAAGTTGRLELVSRDTGADTVTIRSFAADGTTQTGDTSLVGYLRFEIAH